MNKSIPKKRMGRPTTGRARIVTLTLPKETVQAIDKIADAEKSTRSAIIRLLVIDGVRRRGKKP